MPYPLKISGPTADYIDYTTPTIEPEILKVQVSLVRTNEEMVYDKGWPKFTANICVQKNVLPLATCAISLSLPGPSTSPISSTGGLITFLPMFLNSVVRFAFRPSFTRAW